MQDAWVEADDAWLPQVVMNLLANAIRYSPAKSTIKLTARSSGGSLKVAVADEGPGITPEDQEHIFDRFKQASQTRWTGKSGSSGLGLYICKRVIEAHGGSIGVESNTGSGTIFWFELPCLVAGNGPAGEGSPMPSTSNVS